MLQAQYRACFVEASEDPPARNMQAVMKLVSVAEFIKLYASGRISMGVSLKDGVLLRGSMPLPVKTFASG